MAFDPINWDPRGTPIYDPAEALDPQAIAGAKVKGAGTRRVVGILGDVLASFSGGPASYTQSVLADKAYDREQQQMQQRSILAEQLARSRQQADWEHDDKTWATRQQWEADHRADPAAIAIAKAAGLQPDTPEWKAALTAAIPGYGYTAPALTAKTAQQTQVIGARAAASAGLKSVPTYAQAHPKPRGGGSGGKPAKLPTGFILD